MESSDQIESKFCGSCGVRHDAADKYCKSCGESLKVEFNSIESTFKRKSEEQLHKEKTKSNLPLVAGILILILVFGLIVKGQSSPQFGTDDNYLESDSACNFVQAAIDIEDPRFQYYGVLKNNLTASDIQNWKSNLTSAQKEFRKLSINDSGSSYAEYAEILSRMVSQYFTGSDDNGVTFPVLDFCGIPMKTRDEYLGN